MVIASSQINVRPLLDVHMCTITTKTGATCSCNSWHVLELDKASERAVVMCELLSSSRADTERRCSLLKMAGGSSWHGYTKSEELNLSAHDLIELPHSKSGSNFAKYLLCRLFGCCDTLHNNVVAQIEKTRLYHKKHGNLFVSLFKNKRDHNKLKNSLIAEFYTLKMHVSNMEKAYYYLLPKEKHHQQPIIASCEALDILQCTMNEINSCSQDTKQEKEHEQYAFQLRSTTTAQLDDTYQLLHVESECSTPENESNRNIKEKVPATAELKELSRRIDDMVTRSISLRKK